MSPVIATRPIDDAARNGRFQLVLGPGPASDTEFAIARWRDDAWEFGSGHPLPFAPEQYWVPDGQDGHDEEAA